MLYFITGFTGVGKTTIGRELAVLTNLPFIDLDESIEKKINQVMVNLEGFKYILHNYSAVWISGKPIPGSDALDAKFIKLNKLSKYKLWKKTQETINTAYNEK